MGSERIHARNTAKCQPPCVASAQEETERGVIKDEAQSGKTCSASSQNIPAAQPELSRPRTSAGSRFRQHAQAPHSKIPNRTTGRQTAGSIHPPASAAHAVESADPERGPNSRQ